MKTKGARKCIVWRRPETNFLDMSCFNSAAFLQRVQEAGNIMATGYLRYFLMDVMRHCVNFVYEAAHSVKTI